MITGHETPNQVAEAQALQQQYPEATLRYFAYNNPEKYPMPIVVVQDHAAFQLEGLESYHQVI